MGVKNNEMYFLNVNNNLLTNCIVDATWERGVVVTNENTKHCLVIAGTVGPNHESK